jgi:hypothetical protein
MGVRTAIPIHHLSPFPPMQAVFRLAMVAAVLVSLPSAVRAQAAGSGGPVGPTMSAATVGFHVSAAPDDAITRQAAADHATHPVGPYAALMIIGGVGFVAGLIIGGSAGTAVAVAGAVVALYGLYMYLR